MSGATLQPSERAAARGMEASAETVLERLILSFRRSLLARNLSHYTLTAYISTARRFSQYLRDQGMPSDPSALTREHVETFINSLASTPNGRTGKKPSSMSVKLWYASLRAFFKWLVDVDEIRQSPMERMAPPKASGKKRPVLSHDQVKAVLRACDGKSFLDRRDYALILLFIDTGLRVNEMAALELDDIDWDEQEVRVRHGKGDKARTVYFGKRTAKALDQYVYLKGGRRDHPHSHMPYLWLGQQGQLTDAGISWVLKNRGADAGLPNLHAHLFRHFFIHLSLESGMQLGDLQRMTGHAKLESLLGYADAAADQRARDSHRRMGPGDRL